LTLGSMLAEDMPRGYISIDFNTDTVRQQDGQTYTTVRTSAATQSARIIIESVPISRLKG